jgi:hypothetical protein
MERIPIGSHGLDDWNRIYCRVFKVAKSRSSRLKPEEVLTLEVVMDTDLGTNEGREIIGGV